MEEIKAWKTTDGKLHESRSWAEHHQQVLDKDASASAVLDAGGSVAEALRSVDYPGEIDPVLERVTKDTKLVISHWQCRDTPGYKPHHFEKGLCVYCWGDAGSWTGPYGGAVKVEGLVRYAKEKRTEFCEQPSSQSG